MKLHKIYETSVYVDDLESAKNFYEQILGLKQILYKKDRHVFFRCGDSMFLVFDRAFARLEGGRIPAHGAIGDVHAAFAVKKNEIDKWKQRLSIRNVLIEKEIVWDNHAQSIYFRDPSGNSIEIATIGLWENPEA